MKFALALHTDDGMKYGVTVPDLPGCFSSRGTLDEAIDMAKEAIDAHHVLMLSRVWRYLRLVLYLNTRQTLTWQERSGIWWRLT